MTDIGSCLPNEPHWEANPWDFNADWYIQNEKLVCDEDSNGSTLQRDANGNFGPWEYPHTIRFHFEVARLIDHDLETSHYFTYEYSRTEGSGNVNLYTGGQLSPAADGKSPCLEIESSPSVFTVVELPHIPFFDPAEKYILEFDSIFTNKVKVAKASEIDGKSYDLQWAYLPSLGVPEEFQILFRSAVI